jgi:hypothetical protein
MIRPGQGALVMQTALRGRLRPASEVPIGEGEVKPAELQLGSSSSSSSTDTFDASKYEDTYRKRLQGVIDQKVAGAGVDRAGGAAAHPGHRSDGGAEGEPGEAVRHSRRARRSCPRGGGPCSFDGAQVAQRAPAAETSAPAAKKRGAKR